MNREIKILVAEDEEINFMYIEEVLSNAQYTVIHARNGKEAIEIFEKDSGIDLIFMDIKMAIVDGYEAMEKIRTINSQIPIIAQTAYAMPSDKINALKAGFNDYLTKPLKKETILDVIKRFVNL